ncbi:hypothetical protein IGI04_001732 [Brassica rapa subsp. trilocularis]|uniref:Uncharacterized protein n=1 Tax=Brassica rapa subsp. trilocularis TaxID=1813537 RepID=A0ABQ7NTH1_BRACM|nr:hypothetical protein IGI04_001732 [Brassica rapa subsp. trilocularis]
MSNYTIVMTKILETCKSFQGSFRLMLVPGGGMGVTFRNPYDCLHAPTHHGNPLSSLMSLRKLFLIPVYVLSFLLFRRSIESYIYSSWMFQCIEHIGGDMFLNIPKEDDIFMKSITKLTSPLTRRLSGKSSTLRRLTQNEITSLAYKSLLQAHKSSNESDPPKFITFNVFMNHKKIRIKILGALRASNWLFMVVGVLMSMAFL